MKLSLHLDLQRTDYAAHVAFLKDCRVDEVMVFSMLNPEDYQQILGPETTFEDVLSRLGEQIGEIHRQGLGTEALFFYPGRAIPNTIGHDVAQQERFRDLCRACGPLGVKRLGFGPLLPQRDEATSEGWEDLVAGARFMGEAAAVEGLSVALHINMMTGSRLDRPEDVEEFFAEVGRDNVGLMFCFGCIALAGLDVPDTIRRWRELIFVVDLRDVRGTWGANSEEAQFGTGNIDLAASLRALQEIGYEGVVRPEHFPPLGPGRTAEETIAWTLGYCRALLDSL